MPRARSASAMRGSSEAGNGASTGGRAGKWRVAVMHRPVEAEISRSSKISPSIGPTVSWKREPARHLGAADPLDGGGPRIVVRGIQRREDRQHAASAAG